MTSATPVGPCACFGRRHQCSRIDTRCNQYGWSISKSTPTAAKAKFAPREEDQEKGSGMMAISYGLCLCGTGRDGADKNQLGSGSRKPESYDGPS